MGLTILGLESVAANSGDLIGADSIKDTLSAMSEKLAPEGGQKGEAPAETLRLKGKSCGGTQEAHR